MSEEMRKFHLEISEPVAVAVQPANEEKVWGRWQFPTLGRTEDGYIFASFEYGSDNYKYDGTTRFMVSEDDGKTWRKMRKNEYPAYAKMSNGKCFAGFVKKGCYKAEYLDKYSPVFDTLRDEGFMAGNWFQRWYLADDIAEDVDKKVYAMEYDPITHETTTFECDIKWPNMALFAFPDNVIYPATMIFALCNEGGVHVIDGDLYFVTYCEGFDSSVTDKSQLLENIRLSHTYVFKSTDCGRTWELNSQIVANKKRFERAYGHEGYTEPHMAKMPDGSFIMLMRSGFVQPSYYARSTDNCKTWSYPQLFDKCGVLPQILSLDCGVSIASYGRPELRIRATSDPSGQKWEDSIQLELFGDRDDSLEKYENDFWNKSCFYTHLLPLDDHSALLIYSDFRYPDEEGNRVKAIMTRKIRVVMN